MDKSNSEISDGIQMNDLKNANKKEGAYIEESDEVRRLKEKAGNPMLNGAPCAGRTELPSMEAQAEMTPEEKQAQIERLEEKSDKGAATVVSKIMKQPEVQHVIKVEISKQMFISGLFMAFFLVGFFQLFTVAKAVFEYNWTVDLLLGIVLLLIGGAYTVKQIRQK